MRLYFKETEMMAFQGGSKQNKLLSINCKVAVKSAPTARSPLTRYYDINTPVKIQIASQFINMQSVSCAVESRLQHKGSNMLENIL